MAHRKAGGSTSLGRDSASQRLGVKIFGDQLAEVGNIILRQHGTRFHPGVGVKRACDDSLFAMVTGKVHFHIKKVRDFTGKLVKRTFVDVISMDEVVKK